MKTLTIITALLALAAGTAFSQATLEQAQGSIAALKAASLDNSEIPAPIRDRIAAPEKNAAADPDMDTARMELMQQLAIKHGPDSGGHCYNGVWKDVMVPAGFDDGGLIPGTHAYQFAEYAKAHRDWFLNVFKMKMIPTPDSIDEMPAGSVVVYDQGQRDPYGHASAESGHIEVMVDYGGKRYGCSDFCAEIGGMGPMFADAASKEHVTVFVPVK